MPADSAAADRTPPACRGCRYSLVALPAGRCPECGLAFDPADPATLYEPRPGRLRRWAMSPVGWPTFVVGIAAAVFSLWIWRIPQEVHLPGLMADRLFTVFLLPTLWWAVRLALGGVVRLTCRAKHRPPARLLRAMLLPATAGLTLALLWAEVPARLWFQSHASEFEAIAAEARARPRPMLAHDVPTDRISGLQIRSVIALGDDVLMVVEEAADVSEWTEAVMDRLADVRTRLGLGRALYWPLAPIELLHAGGGRPMTEVAERFERGGMLSLDPPGRHWSGPWHLNHGIGAVTLRNWNDRRLLEVAGPGHPDASALMELAIAGIADGPAYQPSELAAAETAAPVDDRMSRAKAGRRIHDELVIPAIRRYGRPGLDRLLDRTVDGILGRSGIEPTTALDLLESLGATPTMVLPKLIGAWANADDDVRLRIAAMVMGLRPLPPEIARALGGAKHKSILGPPLDGADLLLRHLRAARRWDEARPAAEVLLDSAHTAGTDRAIRCAAAAEVAKWGPPGRPLLVAALVRQDAEPPPGTMEEIAAAAVLRTLLAEAADILTDHCD